MIVLDPTEYRDSKAVSFSWMKVFESDEDSFVRGFVRPDKPIRLSESTSAMEFGTAAHCFVLEGPEVFAERFAIHPPTYPGKGDTEKPWNRNSSVCKLWQEAQEDMGRTVISPKEAELLGRMRQSVQGNAEARRLLDGAQMELAIRREYPHLPFSRQGRLDFINHEARFIGDIKTIGHLNDRHRDVERRLYYRQLSFYEDLAAEEFGDGYRCGIVWLEKEGHCRCLVEPLTTQFIEIGRRQNQASLMRLADRYTTGDWQTLPDSTEIGPSVALQLSSDLSLEESI